MKRNREVWMAISLISQLGISMLAPMILCVFAGNFIEKFVDFPVTVILLLLGIAAGFRNCWLLIVNTQGLKPKDGENVGTSVGKLFRTLFSKGEKDDSGK